MSPVTTSMRTEWSRQLASALANGGQVPEDALGACLAEATEHDVPLSTVLITRGVASAPLVVSTLAQISNLPAMDLQSNPPTHEAAHLLPPLLAREHSAIGVRVVGRKAVVAFCEPPDGADVRALGDLIGFELVPCLGDPTTIEQLLSGTSGSAPAGRPPAPVVLPAPAPAAVTNEPPWAAPPTPPAPPLPPDPNPGGHGPGGGDDLPLHVDDLLRYAVSIGASDLHLTANMPPSVRLHGALRPMDDVEPLDNTTLREMIYGVLPQSQRERFEEDHELDTSHTIPNVGRFRVNVALQRGTIAVAMRPIPHEIPDFSTLGLPESVRAFPELRRGLVLVTGPTGSGKSTSLASLIDIINRTKPLHVVTVEDPIEFLHRHKRSVISQREVGSDTVSFSEALRRALRQDPDVILVGELRDLETISTAPHRGRDRPPGLRHTAHPGRPVDHRPHHRRVPAQPAGPDPDPARLVSPGRGHPAAHPDGRRPRAGAWPPRCWSAPRPSRT